MRRTWWSIAIGIPFWMMTSGASAEVYVAGDVGWNSPNKFSHVTGSEGGSGFTSSDLSLSNSLLYGGKLGVMSRWVGIEAEVYNTSLNVKAQQGTTTFAGGSSTGPQPLTGNTGRITTVALNAIVRYPGRTLQPYLGAGVGGFFAHVNDFNSNGSGASDANVGFQLLAGLRYFLTEELALFVEYKYNRVKLNFSSTDPDPAIGSHQLNGLFSSNMIIGGISLHF